MANLSFSVKGNGQPVVLLHGFPFHKEIWHSFSSQLSKTFKVYTPDLPGFGDSPILKDGFSIEQVADAVLSFIKSQNLKNVMLIGHSLGGYVALSMVDKNADLFSRLVLFHSTAYADAEEKKQSRNKVLEFIEKNGVLAFTSNFIEPLFTNQTHPAIPFVKSVATAAKKESVIGYTLAMRDRSDATTVLSKFAKPILFLAGSNDGGITVESVEKQVSLSPHCKAHILTGVAHMGMFEKENECLDTINSFISAH